MRLILHLFAASLLISGVAEAQTALTGGLQGTVTDRSGGALAGSQIEVTNKSLSLRQQTKADLAGRFAVLGLPPSADYEVTVSAAGFEPSVRSGVAVGSSETASVDFSLAPAARKDAIDVTAEVSPVVTDRPEISQTIDGRRLTELPSNNRNLNKFATLDPHVRNTSARGADSFGQTRLSINGFSFRETRYKIDGSINYDSIFNNVPLQTVSLSAVQEFKVLTNAFAADQGNTSTGILITTTKSGTNQFHGEGLFFLRPSGIQANPKLSGRHVPNELEQLGASLGGPIARDKTFFFANYEGTRQNRGAFIFSPSPSTFVGHYREHLGLLRLDHRFSSSHALTLRVNGGRDANDNTNDRVSGFFQPSYGQYFTQQSVGSQMNDTVTFGNKINELRASYINAVPSSTRPVASSVTIVRPNYGTQGGSSFSAQRTEVYQLSDQLSIQKGAHSLRLGGDFIRRKIRDQQYQQYGSYRFAPGPPRAGEMPISFTQQLGVAKLSYGQTQWAGFLQDDWRALPRLTLNLGVRYEYQSITDDYNNFAPRFGFAYDVTGQGSTILRGSAGLFYDQPFFHGLTQKYLLNAPTSLTPTVVLTPGSPDFPVFPNSLSTIPSNYPLTPRNIDVRGSHLLNPYTSQFTFGVQQRLGRDWVATADVIHSLTVKAIQAFNLNAPAPFLRTTAGQVRSVADADATRPLKTYLGVSVRDVLLSTNTGTANYDALDLGLSKRLSRRYQAEAHYIYSSALNNVTDDHLGANPNEWSDVGRAERGPSDFHQRHRFVAHGTAFLPYRSQFSMVATLASGLPINPLTGVDNNGDTTVVDRPAGFGRNSFRGPRQTTFDVSLAKEIYFSERAHVEARADAFNLFNGNNYFGLNNIYGNGQAPLATFQQPLPGVTNVDPSRQFQFGLRFLF